jgi:hypothetical protein
MMLELRSQRGVDKHRDKVVSDACAEVGTARVPRFHPDSGPWVRSDITMSFVRSTEVSQLPRCLHDSLLSASRRILAVDSSTRFYITRIDFHLSQRHIDTVTPY